MIDVCRLLAYDVSSGCILVILFAKLMCLLDVYLKQ